MPRRTSSPARRASAVEGRPPAVSTTRSVGSTHAVVEDQPVVGEPGGPDPGVDARCRAGAGRAPGSRRPWRRPGCAAGARRPRRPRPRGRGPPAPGRPGGRAGPPPTTTAVRAPGTARSSRRQSSSERNACTRPLQPAVDAGPARGSAAGSGCCRWPGRGRRTAPGLRSASSTSRSTRCISTTRVPRRRSTASCSGSASCVAVVGALEHRGEQDPVVRRVRLVAEQGDRSAGRWRARRPAGRRPCRRPRRPS